MRRFVAIATLSFGLLFAEQVFCQAGAIIPQGGAGHVGSGHKSAPQRAEGQPSIAFGMVKISLGMTIQQVEQNLAGGGRHIQMLSDKETAVVYQNGVTDDEGQITFYGGRVAFASFQMPNATNAANNGST